MLLCKSHQWNQSTYPMFKTYQCLMRDHLAILTPLPNHLLRSLRETPSPLCLACSVKEAWRIHSVLHPWPRMCYKSQLKQCRPLSLRTPHRGRWKCRIPHWSISRGCQRSIARLWQTCSIHQYMLSLRLSVLNWALSCLIQATYCSELWIHPRCCRCCRLW
jgi:hypothetical protein